MLFRRPQPHNQRIDAHDPTTSAMRIAFVSARWKTIGTRFLILALALTLAACEEGGSSAGGGAQAGSGNVAAVSVIDLPAGTTSATLGWDPSAGVVESYAVYESRNGGDHTFVGVVTTPRATIPGSPGDAVRISVIAMSAEGKPSNASPPSPELRFHAAAPAPAVAVTATTYSPTGASQPVAMVEPIADGSESATSDTASAAATANTQNTQDAQFAAASDVTDPETELDSIETLESSTRALMVESDARFPLAGLSDAAQNWMQARIEEQFNAGVRLVGSGERDHDGLRELIWQDPSGQLFVSSGQAMMNLVDTANTPSTFEEGVRLRATERFVALADFNGDAIGDWLIEDFSTEDVWIVDGASNEIDNARSSFETVEALLIGEGDFNGDGRHELLWQHADGAIRFGHPTGTLSGLESSQDSIPVAATSVLVAVADMNADGSDDLVSVDQNGRLEWTLVLSGSDQDAAIRFESQVGPDLGTDTLELLVTLDVDDDGRREIAWLNGEALEVWDSVSGPQDF